MEAKAAHDTGYAAACAAAEGVVDRKVPLNALLETDAFLSAQAAVPVQTVLARGSGWGMLHEKRTGKRISSGLAFETGLSEEERPWGELLTLGTFSKKSLSQAPRSFNVSPGWTAVVRDSMRTKGATPLHHLHLGVAQLEAGWFEEARKSFEASLALEAHAPAYRNLALLRERGGDIVAAENDYKNAWLLCGEDRNLAVEICDFYVRNKRNSAFEAFVKALPPVSATHERIQLMKAQLALERGDYPSVRQMLQREFCTIREGELSLSEMWFATYFREAEKRSGRVLTEAEKQEIMQATPPPKQIDFRMK
jgi:tetratricopeptide (TPR) repeat protein